MHFVVPTLDHARVAMPFTATVLGFEMMVTTGVRGEGFCVGGVGVGEGGVGCIGAGAGLGCTGACGLCASGTPSVSGLL